jgi:hypothetical protein
MKFLLKFFVYFGSTTSNLFLLLLRRPFCFSTASHPLQCGFIFIRDLKMFHPQKGFFILSSHASLNRKKNIVAEKRIFFSIFSVNFSENFHQRKKSMNVSSSSTGLKESCNQKPTIK